MKEKREKGSPAVRLGRRKGSGEAEAAAVAPAASPRPGSGFLLDDVEREARAVEERAERAREAAFAREPRLAERRLFGFSIARESLWMEIRSAVKSPPVGELLWSEGTSMRGFLPDALRMVWLCLQPGVEKDRLEVREARNLRLLRDLQGELGPLGLQDLIDVWANGLDRDVELPLILDMGLQLFYDGQVNQAVPMPTGSGGSGGVGGGEDGGAGLGESRDR